MEDRKEVLIDGIASIASLIKGKQGYQMVPIWKGTGKESVLSAQLRMDQFKAELARIPTCDQ